MDEDSEEHILNFDVTPGGRTRGMWPLRVQNPFCTNIVMLQIKSKVMKSKIQWCKNFAPGACLGVTRSKNRILGPFFFF